MRGWRHAGATIAGGAPYGTTKRVRGVPKCRGGGEAACGRSRWGLRWTSLSGHEAFEGCAKMRGVMGRGRSGRRKSRE
eukprot:6697781-Pyramimonas_sp.AAC.1